MIDLDTLPQAVKEALGYYEAFRRLEFPSDDIYFAVDATCLTQVHLITQGKTFRCDVGRIPARYKSKKAVGKLWKSVCEAWNSGKQQKTMDSIWNFSHAKLNAMGLLMTLGEKGIRWNPKKEGLLN